MSETTEVYEIRLRLDTANSFVEAVDIAEKIKAQITKFAAHTGTDIDWHRRVEEILGAPHLIVRAPADFASKIGHFPEVASVAPVAFATQSSGNNDNRAPVMPLKKAVGFRPPKM